MLTTRAVLTTGILVGIIGQLAGPIYASDPCPVRGVLIYESGSPVPDATVFLMKAGHFEKVARTETAADGTFVFNAFPCGKYIAAPNVASRSKLGPIYTALDARKPLEIRIVIPDDSRILSDKVRTDQLSERSPKTDAPANAANSALAPPPVALDGKWHWEIESRIRRDTVERLGGSKAVEEYDKLPEQAQVRRFLEIFGNELNRLNGIEFHDPIKMRAQYMAKTWWTTIVPLPPQVEYAIAMAASRRIMAGPNMEELGKENLAAALAIVRSTAPPEAADRLTAEFEAADPDGKTNMFLLAIRAQMKARIWPSAFLIGMAYLPGARPPYFIAKLEPDATTSWSRKSVPERAEAAWDALQVLADKLESAVSDETGATWTSMSRELGLVPPGFTGPNSVKYIFGRDISEYHADSARQIRYIADAGIFHALWMVETATYY